MGKGRKNSDPSLLTAEHENEPSTTTTNQLEKRQFTWQEIRQHSTKKDRWLVVDGRVYDVTRWIKHPGGQAVLNHYAGQDASVKDFNRKELLLHRCVFFYLFFFQEAFHALHPEKSFAQKYLKSLYIGDAIGNNDKENDLSAVDQELKEDFEKLRLKAVAQVKTRRKNAKENFSFRFV
jgi:fatty acid desaturase 2 (delta-6 desaturase)